MTHQWISVSEAARRLGKSPSTIRRMIESGELIGEREPLVRGSSKDRYRVRLDIPVTPDDASDRPSPDVAAFTYTIDNLIFELSHATEINDHRVERVAELERMVGRLEAERDDATRRVMELQAQLDARSVPWWRRWRW